MRGKASSPARSEAGSIFMVVLLAVVVLSALGATLLTISVTESTYAYRDLWSEGSFWAAEAGIQTGIDQLSINTATSTQAIPVTTIPAGGDYNYRSGRRSDAGPQPLQFVKTRTEAGYSIGSGTGYNPSGYIFYAYMITATGTGPRNGQRELEAQAEFGPVPN